ncbi:MAG TPA: protein kinase, partial [Vicinamibacterales bacterium]|nr:protein kinase [Vicinamibacterales bacterium]
MTTEGVTSAGQAPVHDLTGSLTMERALTGEHTILGTVAYMSPEQAMARPVDARSDIFSFGLVLYEMLTGQRAFDGSNPASVIAAILEREAPSVAGVAPPALDRVLQTCLAKDPDERWQSARDVRRALELVASVPAIAGTTYTKRRSLAIASLIGFVIASILGAAIWATWVPPAPERHALSFQLTPPPGAEFQYSTVSGGSEISPDGRRVAFVAVTNGTPRLWVRELDSLTANELPDTDGARLPFWSPDSRAIGFFANGNLRRIDVSGTGAVVLGRAPDPRGGAWSSNGTILFSPGTTGPLYQVSASGGTPAPLTTLAAGETNHRWPEFMPDGRTVLFTNQGSEAGVYVTTLDRPADKKRVFEAPSNVKYYPGQGTGPGYLLWVAQDRVMAQQFEAVSAQLVGSPLVIPGTEDTASFPGSFRGSVSVSNEGTLLYRTGGTRHQLRWFTANGTALTTLGATDRYVGLRLSPNDNEVLVSIRDATVNGDLWRVDLASGARSRVTSEGGGWYAVWSPDGQQVAFTPFAGGELRITNVRGSGAIEELWKSGARTFPSDWSRDGQRLAFTVSHTDTANDVWLLSMTGTPKAAPMLTSPYAELHAQFSPDGKWLALTTNESGREDVYVQSFPDSATRRLISSGGGSHPQWARDGRTLFYRAPDGWLMSIPFRAAGSSLEIGAPTSVMRLVDPPAVHTYPYGVAVDGRILALTPPSGAAQDVTLTLMTNWESAPQK